jgi:hypothetical protein
MENEKNQQKSGFRYQNDPLQHLFTLALSFVLSYFFFPSNLASYSSMLMLVVGTFFSVHFFHHFVFSKKQAD